MPDLKISATFPGEQLAVEIIRAWVTARATMSQENRDKMDALHIQFLERWHKFWAGELFKD